MEKPTVFVSGQETQHIQVGESKDWMEVMPLGAGSEVGRSCVMLKFKGKTIMLDCGIHPAHTGLNSLPYFDMIDPAEIDLLLVSHFHLDHAAALPYFLEKTTFDAPVFMTHPTKAIYKMLLTDFVKVSNIAVEDMLYTEQDLVNTMDKIECVNFHEVREIKGIKFWGYNAGHVLGAAMFMVEIAGVRILYTGDFSRQEDRHLMAAEIPQLSVDVLIVESTYGVQIHEPREEREKRFTSIVRDIVTRGGRCLIPVFALGRAQELLLILDEFWTAHPQLNHIPIYYASTLAKKCMTVYQTYINMMNEKIREQFSIANPFIFKNIKNLKSMEHFTDSGPCVVMASPGMLQSGLSRELFELWCQDSKNGVILPGYCVEGTLAKHILSEPETVTTTSGQIVPLKLSVNYISFSAHSDFTQTSEFIDILQTPHIVLVHGDANEMGRLKQAILTKYEQKNIQVWTPKNCQTVKLEFQGGEQIAKVVGNLASKAPTEGTKVSGLLVRKDFNDHILEPQDLHSFTQLRTSTIQQKQTIPFGQSLDKLRQNLENLFDDISSPEKNALLIYNNITILFNSETKRLTLEWNSNPINDMLADSVISVILQMGILPTNYPDVKIKEENNSEIVKEDDDIINDEPSSYIQKFLCSQFGDEEVVIQNKRIKITIGDDNVSLDNGKIEGEDGTLKTQVQETLNKIEAAATPLKFIS